MLPLYFIWLYAGFRFGWAERDPTWNDPAWPVLMLAIPGSLLLLSLLGSAGFALVRLSGVAARRLAPAGLIAFLAPTVMTIAEPGWWTAIRWY